MGKFVLELTFCVSVPVKLHKQRHRDKEMSLCISSSKTKHIVFFSPSALLSLPCVLLMLPDLPSLPSSALPVWHPSSHCHFICPRVIPKVLTLWLTIFTLQHLSVWAEALSPFSHISFPTTELHAMLPQLGPHSVAILLFSCVSSKHLSPSRPLHTHHIILALFFCNEIFLHFLLQRSESFSIFPHLFLLYFYFSPGLMLSLMILSSLLLSSLRLQLLFSLHLKKSLFFSSIYKIPKYLHP